MEIKDLILKKQGENSLESIRFVQKQTQVEILKEESSVISMMLQGYNENQIAQELSLKHNITIDGREIKRFVVRNRDVLDKMKSEHTALMVRHMEARVNCEGKMAELIIFAEEVMKKADKQGDFTATVGTINALTKAWQNYTRIKGFTNETIQKADNIINIISDEKSRLRDRIISANFKNVIDLEENEEKENGNKQDTNKQQ